MPDLRLAILGSGQIVRAVHLTALRRLPGVRIVALAETQAAGRDWAAIQIPDATAYSDYRTLLDEAEFDAVVIALPTLLHADAAVRAFARGAHVYLEKPLAASLDEADSVVAAWKRAGTTGRIGFNSRFNRLYTDLRAALRRGEIGAPLAVRTAFTAPWPLDPGWHTSVEQGGGALLELASHHIDLIRWICDTEIVSVHASAWPVRTDDEAAALLLELASGARAQIFVAHGTLQEDRVEVYGEGGKLVVNRYDSLCVQRVPLRAAGGLQTAVRRLLAELRGIPYAIAKRRHGGHEPSYSASLSAFVDAVRTGRGGKPDLQDGRVAQQVLGAARESALRRQSLDVVAADLSPNHRDTIVVAEGVGHS